MEQDSISEGSPERAASTEPSSTRPNPFGDGDVAARKRRRTSMAGSRSRSAETSPPNPDPEVAIAGAESAMKLDSPAPGAAPSTPPQPEPLDEPPPTTEPHSSKVTINLRNSSGMDEVPDTPPSPSRTRPRDDDIKDSVEDPEVDMGPAPPIADDASSSSTSVLTGSDVPLMAVDDGEDDELELVGVRSTATHVDIGSLLLKFPYHSPEQTFYDTVARLVNYFTTPSHFDEVLYQLRAWFHRYLHFAESDAYSMGAAARASIDARSLWQTLPELFWAIYVRRSVLAKNPHTRDHVVPLFSLLARLAAHLLKLDIRLLQGLPGSEDVSEFELVSPYMMNCLGNITRRDETQVYNGYSMDSVLDGTELLHIFQRDSSRELAYDLSGTATDGGTMARLVRLAELLSGLLSRFPRKTMEFFTRLCCLAESIAADSCQQVSYAVGSSNGLSLRADQNLSLSVRLFKTVSAALELVVEKSVNHLSADLAPTFMTHLTSILTAGLKGESKDALEMIDAHREKYPAIPEMLTVDAITREWRFGVLSKLIRSRQMQLRVVSSSLLCSELVFEWKRGQDFHDGSFKEYLRHLSMFLTASGLIDYLLGPTCHPEITQESYNIIGFLAVTETYQPAQTDLFWQTLTSTQDPRIAEALARMMAKTANNLHLEPITYLIEKLQTLPIESFTLYMRDFCEAVIKALHSKVAMNSDISPYKLYLRLLQESSKCGPQGNVEHWEIHQFAANKLKELLQYSTNIEIRRELLSACMADISMKSATTSGSLEALHMIIRPTMIRDLPALVEEEGFARILVDELENTISIARSVGCTPVYASTIGHARRELLEHTIAEHGASIEEQYVGRLWRMLVGEEAACQEDRIAGWQSLNSAVRITRLDNPFLRLCLEEHLPKLSPSLYCVGTLQFVREALIPIANDANSTTLDDQMGTGNGPLELLWQMILTAPPQTIEIQAIQMLVNDIYVEGKSITSFPLHRARKIHFALVNRCLQQMATAAKELQTITKSAISSDAMSMGTGPSETPDEHGVKFKRSLSVLRMFVKTLQGKSHQFAAPDLRSLMLQSPSIVEGDSAELKFQSFDGNQQTDVKPLNIGKQNTAASLLASIREATGFDNYRIFYRGAPLTPTEDQICKSLEELDIHSGLILVKRESDVVSSPVKVKPGASPLEIEILSHFKELWEYLSMDEKLSKEIYQFLVKLPADESVLEAFEDPATSHQDVFPLGEPFKCLYTIHALREYLSTRRLKTQVMQVNTQDPENQHKTALDQEEAHSKVLSLLVPAICDAEVVSRCPNEHLQVLLSFHLVDSFVQLLKDTTNPQSVSQFLDLNLQERLLALLATAAAAPASQTGLELINRSLEALFECCSRSHDFWAAFQKQAAAAKVIQDLLFVDERPFVRKNVAKLIKDRCVFTQGDSGVTALHFAEMLWPMVFELLSEATAEPTKCEEVLNLCFVLMKRLAEADSPVLDIQACLAECERLILSHTSTEDVSHPEQVDLISHGLVSILHHGIKYGSGNQPVPLSASFPRRLFNKHLFPQEDADGPLVPRVILNPSTRSMLNDLIYILCKDNEEQYLDLLRLFSGLTTYKLGNDSSPIPYKYELPPSFERSKSIRSPCGYPGLRNLSNTCYLNSLFTQLFMNTHFRKFIMQVPVPNANTHQLLAETQTLFSELQDNIRRFVDPLGCVNQIMNYDETPIDIHTQMDVDEFYNLLFDRWESQMPSARAKKALRSIYGGQLVQQVKSKECEHISERIEPFSAIQCDIKGIASLQESLQAYVDGEIMEGDNKYKCETCDRHVDAVKRACLKDIPDHVIFHLKRFEFNLRTLQRSKINDHFAFPTKIDMQPYTVEHLSNPDKEAEPDEFELVGVLVHSGTAESGHYYSYIRERPSVSAKDSWVEFNDDLVSAWDPAYLEGSCFGGKDPSQRFDGSLGFEKVYSAYMLFYQRSSSLRKDQDLLKESGNRGPVRVDLKPEHEEVIKEDNWGIVHRYCTNDASHIPFVKRVLSQRWDTYCTVDHKLENLAMRIALDHLDQVASRAKDLPDFQPLIAAVIQTCQKCPRCGIYLFQYFTERPEALRMLLQRSSDSSVRQQTAHLFLFVLGTIKLHYPQEFDSLEDEVYCREHDVDVEERSTPCTITRLVELFGTLFESFHTCIRAWPEFFGTIYEFALMGKSEVAALLDSDLLLKLLMIISADPTDQDLPPKYARMATTVARRQRPPNYEHILALIDIMMERLAPKLLTHQAAVDSPSGRLQLALDGLPVPFTSEEYHEIQRDWPKGQGSIFVDKLIQVDQNATATESILKRLMGSSTKMDQKIYATLRVGITDTQPNLPPVGPYLRAAVWYIQHSNNATNVQQLILYACSQCRSLTGMEGMSYLVFFQNIFQSARRTEGDVAKVRIKSLRDLHRWVPGLLGYMDRSVSYKLEFFLDVTLWQVEPTLEELGEESGAELTREMILAVKKLGIGCLMYLQDTYVSHGAQVPRESVIVFERVIKRCREFFVEDNATIGADLDRQFNELMSVVIEQVRRLVVDEIEEEPSEDWDNSIGSSEAMDMTDLPVAGELNDVDVP